MMTSRDEHKAVRFPRLKAGEELTPRHLNIIYSALEGMMRAMPGANFDEHGYVLVTNSTITAASGSTLGKGTAKLWRLYPDGADVKRADTGLEVAVYNLAAATIASGKVVMVKRVDGYLLADYEECEE
jgi:hypothetical protein